MASKKKHSEMWSDVVSGSVLEISVKGTTKDSHVVATVKHRVAPAKKGDEPTNTVLNTTKGTPLIIALKSPNIYSGDTMIAFMTDADVKARVMVKSPSGKQFGDALDQTFTGKTGDVVRVSFLVITE